MEKIKTHQIVVFIATILLLIAFIIYVIFTFKNSETPTIGSVNNTSTASQDDLPSDIVDMPSSELPSSVPSSNVVYRPTFTEEEETTLNEYLKTMGEGFSVYFEDINSGYSYTYNGEQKYFIASVVKAPYCMYIYDLASQGKCSLDDKFLFKKSDIQEGTGKLKDMEFLIDPITNEEIPIELTMQELLTNAILYSDNTAVELLRKKFNHVGYTEYVLNLGLKNKDDIKQIVNSQINATETGIYAKAIYEFFTSNIYGPKLKEDMMNTRNKMILSEYPMARKYGWGEDALHDMAIVYAPQPYIMVILSDKGLGEKDDFKLFYEVSRTIEKMYKKSYNLD